MSIPLDRISLAVTRREWERIMLALDTEGSQQSRLLAEKLGAQVLGVQKQREIRESLLDEQERQLWRERGEGR